MDSDDSEDGTNNANDSSKGEIGKVSWFSVLSLLLLMQKINCYYSLSLTIKEIRILVKMKRERESICVY